MAAGVRVRRFSAVAALACAAVALAAGVPTAVARAAPCPNESIRERETDASALPDCRAYEQVSPVDKNLTDAAGQPNIVQAEPSGEAVSYFSVAPFPGTDGSPGQAPTYVSARSVEGWATAGLAPPAPVGATERVKGLSEDLADGVVLAEEPSESETSYDAYVVDPATGASRPLASGIGTYKLSFADATPGGAHILFEAKAQLTPGAAAGAYNLYEWSAATGTIELVGALSDGEAPVGGAVAGPGGPAAPSKPGGSTSGFYTQNTISADGTRVFFTAYKNGTIYMREPESDRTVQISAGAEPAYWQGATPSGSFVLYSEGGALYRFDVARFQASDEPEAQALAEAREQLTPGTAGVQGTLGMSDDGSHVYFVAAGALAGDENGNGETAEDNADNLYEWHEDPSAHTAEIVFIARLLGSNLGLAQDEFDWRGYSQAAGEGEEPAGGEKSSRVTPDGRTVLFTSIANLTGYDNAGHSELYLYDGERPPSPGNPVCISCDPTAEQALSGANLVSANETLSTTPPLRNAFLTRNLSADGDRVFFQTAEPLLSAATDGQTNVYEWERAGPASPAGEPDACAPTSPTFQPGSGGCLYLISTGEDPDPSYFGDAGASGDDVFFFTRQPLVGQDRDDNVDLYDARVDGGLAAQNPLPAPAPCAGEETCRPPYLAESLLAAPSSLTVGGAGAIAVASASASAQPKLTRAQQLARALRACRAQHARHALPRRACQARARARYGPRKRTLAPKRTRAGKRSRAPKRTRARGRT